MESDCGYVVSSGWGPGELERALSCLACGQESPAPKYDDLEDLLGHLPGRWNFLECSSCSSLHLDPRPTIDAIGKAYPDAYVTHTDSEAAHARDNGPGLLWRLANGYVNSRFGSKRQPATGMGRWIIPLIWPLRQQLDYFYRHLSRNPGRLLDVGCGNGAFLLRARDAGWGVQGIEPDSRAALAAATAGLSVYTTTINSFVPEKKFDRITLSHVFEHVHDPVGTLKHCHDWLNPGGELWMSLPNPRGIGSRVFGRSWFALDPPRHLFLPPPEVVIRLMREAGFVNPKLRRRGRGARSSIVPSVAYAKVRGESARHWNGTILSILIDLIGSFIPGASEETVVVASRAGGNGKR